MSDQMGPPVKQDEEYNLKIEVIGNKGDGIAKIENYTIFVPGTKVGDQVKIRIKSALPKFAFAEIIQEEKETKKEDTEDFGEDKTKTSETNPN